MRFWGLVGLFAALIAAPVHAQPPSPVVEPVQGPTYSYSATDFSKTVLRSLLSSQAGGAMADGLPSQTNLGSVQPTIRISNVDPVAMEVVAAGSGTTFGTSGSSISIPPGRNLALTYDGVSQWTIIPPVQPYPYTALPAVGAPCFLN